MTNEMPSSGTPTGHRADRCVTLATRLRSGSVADPKHLLVECPRCEGRVNAPSHGMVSVEIEETGDYVVVNLLKCPGCGGPIVSSHFAQDYDGVNWDESTPVRAWPDPTRQLAFDAPSTAIRDFEEAQRCMSVGAHTAAAMLVRRVLEGIAMHQQANGRTLAAKIEDLKQREIIDARFAEWADSLRVVGNDAAHDMANVVTREDAADVLLFAEALADYLYTFRRRYEQFIDRRRAKDVATD